jgi:ribosome-associated protein
MGKTTTRTKKPTTKKTTTARKTRTVAPRAAAAKTAAKTRTAKRPATKKSVAERDEAREVALMAARYALEKKASEVHLLDLRGITSMTDFFIVATGDGDRQVKAIAENVIAEMRDTQGITAWRSEGWDGLHWVIIDFVDFVVHVFQPEARRFYNVERLWADAPMVEVTDTETKPVAAAKKKKLEEDFVEVDDHEPHVRVISDFRKVRG